MSIRCVKCSIRINRIRRHSLSKQSDQTLEKVRRWVYPRGLTETDYLCHACWELLNQNIELPPLAVMGHRNVCITCGRSILRVRSRLVLTTEMTERERLVSSTIAEWIQPYELQPFDEVCIPCWLRARRATDKLQPHSPAVVAEASPSNITTPLESNLPRSPEPQALQVQEPNETSQIKAEPEILMPTIRRPAATACRCLFSECNDQEKLDVPESIGRKTELDLVFSKVRETTSSIRILPRTDSPSRVPDTDTEPRETEFALIKMEIKTEEEEYQEPTADPLSAPAENQSSPWDAYADAEGSSYLPPQDDQASTTSSVTLTASEPSDQSASDSEESDSLAPSNIESKLTWTDRMNRHLIRSYILFTEAERRRSRAYARLKQAFGMVFPRIKVTRSQLEEQRKIICRKRLVSEDDVFNIKDEIPYTYCPKGSIVNPKGLRLPLSKVTSGD